MKLFRLFAGVVSVACVFAFTACHKIENESIEKQEETIPTETIPETEWTDPGKNEIFWLAPYDINPAENQERSVALALFEDQFGGKINWIACTEENQFETLTNRILGGDPVDMFPYEAECFPDGVYREQYAPLDDYLDLNDPIWYGMREAIDAYAWNDQHYVVPYAVTDPVLLTYSRKMCEDNQLDDPYTLYQNGEWTWDKCSEMMQEFTAKGEDRYGICGLFGKALLQSSGTAVVQFNHETFSNHINDPEIEQAEEFLQNIHEKNLYQSGWFNTFPETHDVLFYAMSDWSLSGSNAANPDEDLMVVPFPKAPNAEKYFLSGNYAAEMLVKNSSKGEAVAKYIYCERLAETEQTYQEQAKQAALLQETSVSGQVLGFLTEEQYDAIQEIKQNLFTVIDFGYGMGSTMYGEGEYTVETRGVMNNLNDGFLNYSEQVTSWETLKETCSSKIDSVLESYSAISPT